MLTRPWKRKEGRCRRVDGEDRWRVAGGARGGGAAGRSKFLGSTDRLGVSLRRCTRVRAAGAKLTVTKSKLISPTAEQHVGYGGAEQSSGAGVLGAAVVERWLWCRLDVQGGCGVELKEGNQLISVCVPGWRSAEIVAAVAARGSQISSNDLA